MKLTVLSARTKKEELKVSAETKKSFNKYLKNICYLDYENDKFNIYDIMESWLASFADSDEFKNIQKMVDEKISEEEAEKEAEKARKEFEKAKKIEQKREELKAKLEALNLEALDNEN